MIFKSIHFLCRLFLQMYTLPPMKTSLLNTLAIASLITATPASAAYIQSNPDITALYGPDYRVNVTRTGVEPPADHTRYYGIPEQGVNLLERTRRDSILQELSQRVINLQKIRNRDGITPEYTREAHIYERLLRRTQNLGIAHYRAPEETHYRMVWRNGELIKVPRLTPSDINQIVDLYEYDRAVRGSPDDECKMFSGERQSTCRYQQRVDQRNRS